MARKDNAIPSEGSNHRSTYNITGVAGEYFVAAELSRRGWIATITLKNAPNIDVMATRPDGSRTVNIQVKTRAAGNRKGWVFNKRLLVPAPGPNFYIAFVDLKGQNENPDYYLIPKNLFAEPAEKRHRKWVGEPGRSGRLHRDNAIRVFVPSEWPKLERYHNNWDFREALTQQRQGTDARPATGGAGQSGSVGG
jgi:hypothetical protein